MNEVARERAARDSVARARESEAARSRAVRDSSAKARASAAPPAPSAAPKEKARRSTAARLRRGERPISITARNDSLSARSLSAPLRVCAGGDVTLGTNLDRAWSKVASRKLRDVYGKSDEPDSLIAPLRPFFDGADVALVNVESAVGAGDTPSKCGPRSTNCFAFRANPSAATALRSLAAKRVVVGNVANNHTHDAGDEGADSTVAVLSRAGILVTGADTMATPVPTPGGDTIGVLGFYTSTDTPDARDTAAVYRHVARAASKYKVVIATMHLGAEGREAQRVRDMSERYLRIDRGNPIAFADAAVRGGAALVIGHGPHVLRGMEWRSRGALIAYSLGNLLTYGPFGLKEPMNRGAVLCTTIDRTGRVSAASLASTVQLVPGVLQRDDEQRAAALVDSLTQLDFAQTGAVTSRSGVLKPRPR